jgi:hypothetical protein
MPITTIQLGAFLPMVLPHCAGVPEPVATFNLRLAAIEFCERSRAWRHISQVNLDQQNATLAAPAFSAIHEIEYAMHDKVPLAPIQFSEIEHGRVDDYAGSPPKFVTQVTPNTVSVYPFKTGLLEVSLFLKPRFGNQYGDNPENPLEDAFDAVPHFLLTQHGEPIAFGALARIFAIPNQPFSNPQMAGLYTQRFNAATDSKFSANLRGQHRAAIRSKFNDF